MRRPGSARRSGRRGSWRGGAPAGGAAAPGTPPAALTALEDEDFGALLGAVYVRGAIRSYATYLGLDGADLVTTNALGAGEPPTAQPPPLHTRRAVGERRPGNHRRAVVAAGGR